MVGTWHGPLYPRVLCWEYWEPGPLVPQCPGLSRPGRAMENCALEGAGPQTCPGANHANLRQTFNKRSLYALNEHLLNMLLVGLSGGVRVVGREKERR